MAYKTRNDSSRAHSSSPTAAVTREAPRILIGDKCFDTAIAARNRAMQTARASTESCSAADRLCGALPHPDTTFPFVEIGQAVWFLRDRQGCLRGTLHSFDGKTVYIRLNGRLFSSHKSRTRPFVSQRTPPSPAPLARPASISPAPIRTHTPAPPAPAALPDHSRAYLAPASDPAPPSHPRWDSAKATELPVFISIHCKNALPVVLMKLVK